MAANDRLETLFDRWHAAEAEGRAVMPEELCRDSPELLEDLQQYVRVLEDFEALRTTTWTEPPGPEAPAAEPWTLPAVGATFDGYRILAELGRGGMGCVFRVRNLLLERDEALKVMLPDLAGQPQARARFLREARAMAALRHDHIVEILHVREAAGVPYLAMPLLQGETLADRLKREKFLPAAEVVRIGLQMAEGLAEAQDHALIHRDIKPSNVWVEAGTQRVKLLDFGLVRPEGDGQGLTADGVIVGTPAYLSPEQLNGTALDGRSDLFSMGSVLYECATGRRAFPGATLTAILAAVAHTDPPPANTLRPAIPDALSDLLQRLLHKRPEQRPASAREVAQQLRDLQAGGPPPGVALADGMPGGRLVNPPDGAPGGMPPTLKALPPRPRRWLAPVTAACLMGFCLIGVAVLSGTWPSESGVVANRGAANGPASNKVASLPISPPSAVAPKAPVPPARGVESLRVEKFDIFHFKRTGEKTCEARGLMGEKSFAATLRDQVTVSVQLTRPAHVYLLAFNPDGSIQLCYPENPDEPPSLTDRLHFPADRSKCFGLTDGVGLMGFAVVASDQPLPPWKGWSAQNPAVWRHSEGRFGEVWRDDGNLLDTQTTMGVFTRSRGEIQDALDECVAVTQLADSLKRGRPEVAVGSIGFVVRRP